MRERVIVVNDQVNRLRKIAKEKTWVSFLYNNHPYSLLHWSVAGFSNDERDVWLLQDEMTFETQSFVQLDEALAWIEQHMPNITDIL
nr:YqkC family protein [Anoxybacillus sp. ST4]